jgi:energy-coupling factor transport system ATP-binding protein
MRQRLEEVLDLLSLSAIRNRPLNTLSGGQQQRVAIAAAMTMNPAILLLDEPTSALDPVAADEVMSTIQRLVHDLGLTVLIAEHRIERVMSFADRVLLLDHEGHAQMHSPQEAMRQLPVSPVLTQLADLAGAQESPLTVRDTRRVIEPLRQALSNKRPALRLIAHDAQPAVIVNELSYARGRHVILRDISLTMKTGSITAVMGRNGAGKSTLLHALMGDFSPTAGSVKISGEIPHHIQGSHLLEVVSIVPQQPSDLFLADRVAQECRISDKAHNVESGTTRAILALLAPTIEDSQHPRDLSEGQKLTLALAIALAGSPDVLLLDEPTRGLDSTAKIQLVKFLNEASRC